MCRQRQDSRYTDQHVQVGEPAKSLEIGPGIISSWKAGDTNVVHREKDHIDTDKRDPKVDVSQPVIHQPAKHLGEPMVYSSQHAKEGRATHHQMEMGHYKIGIVQLNVYGRIAQKNTSDPTREEERDKTDRKEHRRCKPDVPLPQGSDIVKDLYCRRNSDDQGQQGKNGTQERIHAGYKHVMSPNHEGKDGDEQHGSHHGFVSKDGLSRIGGNDFGGDPKGRQENNIYFGVTEEPEQVLKQDGASSLIRKSFPCNVNIRQEKACTETAVKDQQQGRAEENGEGKQTNDRGKQECPDREG